MLTQVRFVLLSGRAARGVSDFRFMPTADSVTEGGKAVVACWPATKDPLFPMTAPYRQLRIADDAENYRLRVAANVLRIRSG